MTKKGRDYYFAIAKATELMTGYFVVITPKKMWDKENRWDDTSGPIACLPTGFYELQESMYEYTGSESKAKQVLLNAGFIENNNIL